jgi:gliding motility-associated protein GldM
MAGGKLSARQKMINLMYLVFIAMMAMNMSKEVLSAFGLMNERLTESNEAATQRNADFMAGLAEKAVDKPEKFKPLKSKADQIKTLAENFNSYLANLKTQMTAKVDDTKDYEAMDNSAFLDEYFFVGDRATKKGQEFLDEMAKFRNGVNDILKDEFPEIANDVQSKFATDPIPNTDGKKIPWLESNFKQFPLVASLTKMTQLQSDIKTTESESLSAMLAGALSKEISMTNYTTLMETSKSAYFNGETFDGEIVLGRKDESTKPTRVELTLDGRPLQLDKDYVIQEGKVKLKVNAGRAGEHKIEGQLIFAEDGQELEVPVSQSFATVPKPNSATISADKMNVVYRGVTNPMTISFAGVSDNKVVATGEGLSRGTGVGKYNMNPGSGREVTINVTGTLPDGQRVSDKATFRIKDIPKPTGTIRGEDGSVSMQRNSLEISTVGAKLDDFDFDLPLNVSGFKFKVPGQPTMTVGGNKLNARAKGALRKAKRGETVQIFDIQAKIRGNSTYKLKKVSPVIIELTN